jgi:hypothetical protein
MMPRDDRYAHWQQLPDEALLDYVPEPDLREVTLETLPQVAAALLREAEEEETPCRER